MYNVQVRNKVFVSSSAIHLSESGSDSDREVDVRPPPPRRAQETARMGMEQDESMMSYEGDLPDEGPHMEDSNVRYGGLEQQAGCMLLYADCFHLFGLSLWFPVVTSRDTDRK